MDRWEVMRFLIETVKIHFRNTHLETIKQEW